MCEKITTINHPPSRPVQESGPAGNISSAHQTDPEDPEAALDNFVRCINGQPQTILPDQPVETCLPDYSDHPSAASAPSAEYATVSETEAAAAAAGDREAVAAGTGGREAAGASAGAGEAAGTAARSNNWSTIDSAAEEAAGGARSIQNELEVPPSYDAAMRGEV